MKTIWAAAIIIFSCIVLACEEKADSLNLPYHERLVIDGMIRNQDLGVQNVRVVRTLPLNEIDPSDIGVVTNADVFLQCGDTVRQLLYQDELYRNLSLSIFAGKCYTLTVDWNGKHAWATTVVPYSPAVDTIEVNTQSTPEGWQCTAEAFVSPRVQEAYTAHWTLVSRVSAGRDSIISSSPEQTPLTMEQAAGDGRIHFQYSSPAGLGLGDTLYFDCIAYDKPYYDYYISRGDPFFSGVPTYSYFEGPVRWNVKGDGVGLFVGWADTFRKIGLP